MADWVTYHADVLTKLRQVRLPWRVCNCVLVEGWGEGVVATCTDTHKYLLSFTADFVHFNLYCILVVIV